MIKLYQKIVDSNNNDSLRVCLCSLLELEVDDVPDFAKIHGSITIDENGRFNMYGWFDVFTDQVILTGSSFRNKLSGIELRRLHEYEGVDGLFIARVPSPKYWISDKLTHVILINKHFEVIHDPNPNHKGIVDYSNSEYPDYNGVMEVFIIETTKDPFVTQEEYDRIKGI